MVACIAYQRRVRDLIAFAMLLGLTFTVAALVTPEASDGPVVPVAKETASPLRVREAKVSPAVSPGSIPTPPESPVNPGLLQPVTREQSPADSAEESADGYRRSHSSLYALIPAASAAAIRS